MRPTLLIDTMMDTRSENQAPAPCSQWGLIKPSLPITGALTLTSQSRGEEELTGMKRHHHHRVKPPLSTLCEHLCSTVYAACVSLWDYSFI